MAKGRNYKRCAEEYKRIFLLLDSMRLAADKTAAKCKTKVGDLALMRLVINIGKKCEAAAKIAHEGWECDAANAKYEEKEEA